MTNDDVISAAFRVWGRELYKNTSLTKLAETLGVSKPALYRHFPDKHSLMEAMEERFYDGYAAAIMGAVAEAAKNDNREERLLVVVKNISGYFARHLDYFIYSIIGLHNNKKEFFFNAEALKNRGVSFNALRLNDTEPFPSALFLAGATGFLETALFHKRRFGIKGKVIRRKQLKEAWFTEKPSEGQIGSFTEAIAERVRLGLLFDRAIVDALPYNELEKTGKGISVPPDPLLKAVAEAVAEEGPWNASMEMVAKRSGFSKSGLYAHFKSKQDMLSRLFMSEFERIAQCTAARTALGKNREEKLYLAILSITDYLLERPEILVALGWVRIQQLELDLSVPTALYDFFTDLKTGASFEGAFENVSQWILLLLVAVLKHHSETNTREKFDYKSMRRLFRFICLGVEGMEGFLS